MPAGLLAEHGAVSAAGGHGDGRGCARALRGRARHGGHRRRGAGWRQRRQAGRARMYWRGCAPGPPAAASSIAVLAIDREGNKRAAALRCAGARAGRGRGRVASTLTARGGVVTAGERIHVIGIAGSGAAGTALLTAARRMAVDGRLRSRCALALHAAARSGRRPHGSSVMIPPTWTAWTGSRSPRRCALVPDLPELVAAQSGAAGRAWQALLGELMAAEGRIGLAVTGTHGKSTTTALLGHLLIDGRHGPDRRGRRVHEGLGRDRAAGEAVRRSWSRRTSSATTSSTTSPPVRS